MKARIVPGMEFETRNAKRSFGICGAFALLITALFLPLLPVRVGAQDGGAINIESRPPKAETTDFSENSGSRAWVIYIGNQAYAVAAKPVQVSGGSVYLGLDAIWNLGGSVKFDATSKTINAELAEKEFQLEMKSKKAVLGTESIPPDALLLRNNKWYLAAQFWEKWGFRPRWNPIFKAWQVIGKLTRISYNKESRDLVFESTLPVRVIEEQDYAEKVIKFTVLGAFIVESEERSIGSAEVDKLKVSSTDVESVLTISVRQKETTGFKLYSEPDNKFFRVNFRNHFQLADFEKTASGEIRLKVKFGKPTFLTARELSSPDRLVLDFADSIYTDATAKHDVGIGVVKSIRIGQFSQPPDQYVVRVVVDLTERTRYRVIPTKNKDTYYIQFLGKDTGRYAIMLDAGHGGSDPGALSPFTELQEKEINLDIALRLQAYLGKKGQSVYLTRDDDFFISLQERADIANRILPMVFVSVHTNSIGNPDIKGAMTFHFESSGEGKKLAAYIQQNLVNRCRVTDKGVRTANFFVLRETVVPAVLVEVGFITNSQEESLLSTPEYRQKLAEAIGEGILDYCADISGR
ncbi:MAG: N-acetylmuramoyl-L-alanine amidase [bacterium]|jgi:N-acetylmuramoyl-L-alanine amidase CwlD